MTTDDQPQESGLVLQGTWEVDDREYTATDDLRTRAREAAERRWPLHVSVADATPRDWTAYGRRDGFVKGAVWHAAQQPSREQVAPKVCPEHHEASGTAHDPGNSIACAWSDDITDAVLALFDGAGS